MLRRSPRRKLNSGCSIYDIKHRNNLRQLETFYDKSVLKWRLENDSQTSEILLRRHQANCDHQWLLIMYRNA